MEASQDHYVHSPASAPFPSTPVPSVVSPPTPSVAAPHREERVAEPTEPSQPTHKSMHILKPLYLLWQIEAGEGTSGGDISDYVFSVGFDGIISAAILDTETDPKLLAEVQSCPDWPHWKEAMVHEMSTLEEAGTWVTVLQLSDKNIVSLKWVFHMKCKADGNVNKYKARLITHSSTQVNGINYFVTFSPITKLASF